MIHRYIDTIDNINEDAKFFIKRQINRMPDHYYLAFLIICSIFYFFKIKPKTFHLLNKFFSSLSVVKSYEN